MGQKPIAVRIKTDVDSGSNDPDIVTVGEAARRLGVSERTVFRLLKTGELERVDSVFMSAKNGKDDRHDAGSKQRRYKASAISSTHMTDTKHSNDGHALAEQVKQKDAQIAELVRQQQEMTVTIRRLQEQMYELAHLVLSHNAAAAQARAEAELRLQEQASAVSRRGLAGLLGPRPRK